MNGVMSGISDLSRILHELDAALADYFIRGERKEDRHVIYQQTGAMGRLLFENFYDAWKDWFAKRSWFCAAGDATVYYGATKDGVIRVCSWAPYVGLTVDVAWVMFQENRIDCRRGGVQ